ncbi:GTP-dependent zinc transferase KNAG_0D00410 [Huiozyma naganishii CBS 8797]|uniref:CobW/HypB/UreG nucleotide-binding domain-containing protein n=1 Tax=Huiozyma naganishii (strain ATCC MYA-139 / BCRC 22969 / CBS 8797 / KCTC 17520 / NBRC 10181 / NCYC 3082 / Yp74L-3) TaxID=1071383 RepID=J7S5D6_HUIN7|nr:hypothetical protein KNAG_0D00410 [Kazachstania naganishii CBS 8797]CCK69794.1 hypothetical protein KNAG_0D00410 [Kazachstania naganishii CBS 8797]
MSALKSFEYNSDDDGELPPLVTGSEANLIEIFSKYSKSNNGKLVTDEKIDRVNKQNAIVAASVPQKRIPVTIITGYLGSGKSTLLEKIALKGSDRKIAVILNEFGDSSEIEKAMTIKNGSASYQEWLDLGNGCLCCSLKNVGVKAIEDMIARSPGAIDYILLETSGIADPAPIAKMFWQDEGLNSSVYIDGVITVLDAEHILKCLDDVSPDTHWHGEKVIREDNLTIAHFQLAMGDIIVLNKFDKVEGNHCAIEELQNRIRQVNEVAPIYCAKYGDVELDKLMDIHAYEGTFSVSEKLGATERPTLHDPRMMTVTLDFPRLRDAVQYKALFTEFLQVLLWKDFGVTSNRTAADRSEIQRTKGIISYRDAASGETVTKVVQGVRDTYDVFPARSPREEHFGCKLVFIGKHLDKTHFESLLDEVLSK